jgi:hypothetical protein
VLASIRTLRTSEPWRRKDRTPKAKTGSGPPKSVSKKTGAVGAAAVTHKLRRCTAVGRWQELERGRLIVQDGRWMKEDGTVYWHRWFGLEALEESLGLGWFQGVGNGAPEGFWDTALNFLKFLPYFIGLLILGVIKSPDVAVVVGVRRAVLAKRGR